MRKKKIDEAGLPSENLAVYQLVSKESGGIIKEKNQSPPHTCSLKRCVGVLTFSFMQIFDWKKQHHGWQLPHP